MTQSGSYNVASFATNMEAEIRRLNAQVDLFWTLEHSLLQRYGLQDGMYVLDCGCGPGRLIELLKGQMPGLRCTGLEMDPQLVEVASLRIAELHFDGCRIVQGTAEQPELTDAVFDFIIMRLVLEHVPNPVLALQSLSRLLKPGGRLVVIANDFEFHLRTWPPVPELDKLYEAYCASRRKDGGDPCIGRRLPRLLAQAELKVVGYEIEVAHNTVLGDTPFLKAEGAGIPAQLVRSGFLDGEILEAMTHSWRAMLLEPNHSIMRPLFVGVGERTAETRKASADRILANEAPPIEDLTASRTATIESSSDNLVILLDLVAEVLGEKLKELGKKLVEPEDILTDLGMDSLAALNLQEKIKSSTGVEIPIVKLLDYVSVSSLAKDIDTASAKKGLKPIDNPQKHRESTRWEEGEI